MAVGYRRHRLAGHDPAVYRARPDREPNKATMCEWIARRENQKYAERRVAADDHERGIRESEQKRANRVRVGLH